MEVVDVKDPIMRPYCVPSNLNSSSTYTPLENFINGDFILVKPHDLFHIPMWMGRPQCDVVKDEENKNFNIVKALSQSCFGQVWG
jgi:hypothetical protein